MSLYSIYAIAMQGLRLEKLRIDTVANNIANQHTLSPKNVPIFQAMQVVAKAKLLNEYINKLEKPNFLSWALAPQTIAPNKVYQPANPYADSKGYVSYPGINTVDEMTTLLTASRAYEANIKIMNTAYQMYLQALTIGELR